MVYSLELKELDPSISQLCTKNHSKVINQKSSFSVPLIFCNLAKSHIDPEGKKTNNKCQRSMPQSMAYQRVTSHGKYCGNFLLLRFLNEIF